MRDILVFPDIQWIMQHQTNIVKCNQIFQFAEWIFFFASVSTIARVILNSKGTTGRKVTVFLENIINFYCLIFYQKQNTNFSGLHTLKINEIYCTSIDYWILTILKRILKEILENIYMYFYFTLNTFKEILQDIKSQSNVNFSIYSQRTGKHMEKLALN